MSDRNSAAAPGTFTKLITYFYAFLVMAVMYGDQQYTKAFGLPSYTQQASSILLLGFGCAGGAPQTGLSVVQEFVPGPKGRNTGIYYTFMGAASYTMPVIVGKLTVISGQSAAVYTLMILMCVLAAVHTIVLII